MWRIAYFVIFFAIKVNADYNADQLLVAVKMKQAVLQCESRIESVKTAWHAKQIKRSFMLLLDVPPNKLPLFINEDILDAVQTSLREDFSLPLEKQRFELILQLLRTAQEHQLIPRIFDAYQQSTKMLTRRDQGTNLFYAVGKGLERYALQDIDAVDLAFQDLFDTRSPLQDPMQVFRLAEAHGLKIRPLLDIQAWYDIFLEIEPNLFLKNEAGEFFYPRFTRKVFSHPNFLYFYLKNKDPKDLPETASEYAREFEETVPKENQLRAIPPAQWADIFAELQTKHPELIPGVFSLVDNKIFSEFYATITDLNQTHIEMCTQLIAQANQEHPQELISALRFIVRRQNGYLKSEVDALTPKRFMELLKEGKLPQFELAIRKAKVTRTVLRSLEEQILRSQRLPSIETILWAEKTVDTNLTLMDELWADMHLSVMTIDPQYMAHDLSEDNINRILYVRRLISRIFGEDYVLELRALKIHIRELKRAALK